MKILNLSLENFRGIKSLSIDFGGKDTDIYGANGLGKTTIANAICWLLIDRPASEEKDFTPKTVGAKGLHHSAEISLKLDDGQIIAFKKDFYEKYTKKKGAAEAEYTGNVVDYYIDGVKSKQKDYNTAVENAAGLPLEKIKMLLVLGYFCESMKMDEKRKILFELAGEFTDQDVFAANEDLVGLMQYLAMPGTSGKNYTIDQWKSIAAEERRKLNKDLEFLPARIDEVQKSLPETVEDLDALTAKLQRFEEQKENLEKQKLAATSADGQEEAKALAIAKLKTEIETKRAAYMKQGAEANAAVNQSINEVTAELRDLDGVIYQSEKNLANAKDKLATMTAKRQALMTEYAATRQEVWDAGQEICPTCGQNLPVERVAELRAAFNRRKSEKLTAINKRGQAECSQDMIRETEAMAAEIGENLKNAQATRTDTAKRLQNLKETVVTLPAFETTEEYLTIEKQIREVESAKTENTATENLALNYQYEITKVGIAIQNINERIATVKKAKESQARIKELENELKDTAKRLEYVEKGINLCEEFTRTKARMVTESINKHFSFVRFILFREQINGGLKEICEPTGQNTTGGWVEYRSLNYAAKINAQMDIVNTLNKHYGVNLPVIMDQGESVSAPLKIDNQLIRLIVSAEDKDLRVEIKD